MKRLLTLFFYLLISYFSFAQDKRPLLKLSPLSLVDVVGFPAVQGGFEFSITPKISWYNEIGFRYGKSWFDETDTSFVPVRGFKVKTEVRYYLGKSFDKNFSDRLEEVYNRLEGIYLAVNLFYIRDVHNASVSYYYQKDSNDVRGDEFGVRRNIFGANFVAGWQIAAGRRFMFDLYVGLGARYRDIFTVNKEYVRTRDTQKGPVDLNVGGFRSGAEADGGSSVMPNLTLGFRVCFKL